MEMPLPDELTTAVEAYLKDYRLFLCRRRGRWTVPIGNALWVSQDGSPLGDRSAYQQLVVRTREAFGHPVNPHHTACSAALSSEACRSLSRQGGKAPRCAC